MISRGNCHKCRHKFSNQFELWERRRKERIWNTTEHWQIIWVLIMLTKYDKRHGYNSIANTILLLDIRIAFKGSSIVNNYALVNCRTLNVSKFYVTTRFRFDWSTYKQAELGVWFIKIKEQIEFNFDWRFGVERKCFRGRNSIFHTLKFNYTYSVCTHYMHCFTILNL